MFGKEKREFELKRELKSVTSELAALNYELATQMINLSVQTEDVDPLFKAVDALTKTEDLYSIETTPRDYADIQKKLGDSLLAFGRESDDPKTLDYAIRSYRNAITLASLLGDSAMRRELKRNYSLAQNLLGQRGSDISRAGAA